MYVNQCYAGYAMPVKAGKFDVIGIRATVDTTSSASRVVLCDDTGISSTKWGRILDGTTPYDYTTNFVDIKGIANTDANLEVLFPEPIKVRHGISAVITDNIVAGSLMVYTR